MQKVHEMRPTKRTIHIRQNKIIQLYRFIVLNTKILKTAFFPPKK
ncbi:hypothetical protein [Rummeliibacillus suwonensis]|nr:hypothetical protein [Rummeliibacillus suwonensis]